MALWEYKVITSGKGGFATPALLESFLNQLGTEEWEIIEFRTQPDNPLAFQGLARRPTQRDWTLEAAAAAAARVEADKLRAEFAAKFQAATSPGQEPRSADADSANPNRDESFRRPRDTEYDQDPYALDDSSEDEADAIPEEDQLPTFFEAIRPHMRRNQKGPGHSVGLEFLIKKFDLIEEDLLRALTECGFSVPEDEDDPPTYIEYDGDLYWLNINRRGEIWINTREKPRQVFRVTKGTVYSAPKSDEVSPGQPSEGSGQDRVTSSKHEAEGSETTDAGAQAPVEQATAAGGDATAPAQDAAPQPPLPEGTALLDRLRKLMRRSRGGWSGTISYMARALRRSEADLSAALAPLGLVPPATTNEKAPVVEVGELAYWLNKDGRGGIWVNVRETRRLRKEIAQGEAAADGPSQVAGQASTTSQAAAGSADSGSTQVIGEGAAIITPEPGQAEPTAEEKAAALAAVYAELGSSGAAKPAPNITAELLPSAVAPSVGLPTDAAQPHAEAANIAAHAQACEAPEMTAINAPAVQAAVAAESGSGEEAPALPPQSTTIEGGAVAPMPTASAPVPEIAAPVSGDAALFASVRPHMREGRSGIYTGEICLLAEKNDALVEPFVGRFVTAGLKLPEKPREKPVYVEDAGDLFWFTRNSKGELWLNAKPSSQSSGGNDTDAEEEAESQQEPAGDEKKPRRPRRRTRSEE